MLTRLFVLAALAFPVAAHADSQITIVEQSSSAIHGGSGQHGIVVQEVAGGGHYVPPGPGTVKVEEKPAVTYQQVRHMRQLDAWKSGARYGGNNRPGFRRR